jgi:sugar-specific transcriptional regulator TrmB
MFQLLLGLGLTELQTKIYLALVTNEPCTVKTISIIARVARQDVYRIVPNLQKMGLVKRIIAPCVMYKAVPIREGCTLLLKNKQTEFSVLQKKSALLFEKSQSSTLNNEIFLLQDAQFSITSSRRLFLRDIDEKDKKCQKSIAAISDWKFLRRRLFEHNQEYVDALKKGVSIRIITEEHKIDSRIEKIVTNLKKKGFFEIHVLPSPVPNKLVLFDEKEAHLCVIEREDASMNSLGSSNPVLVKILVNYFEELWKKANNVKENTTESYSKSNRLILDT